jgi:exopolyphosphatase/guanosine-5'-triphosphate,3'-diphosphate pyrophosphatase
MGENLAALDIGTNSFHLVVARFTDVDAFEVVAREKEMVRLGSGSGDMKLLDPDAIDRGIEALKRMRKVADIHQAELYAVATSAVREATNASEFLRRAALEAGVEVRVIAGTEEARLIYLGVLQALPVFDRRVVLIDIGGGSTEILVGEQGETLTVRSLKLGALRLTRRFFPDGVVSGDSLDDCRRHVRAALAPVARDVARHGFHVAVGCSGTVATVVAAVHARRDDTSPEPRTFNAEEVTRKEVKQVVKALARATTPDDRRRIPGVDPSRADIILAGAVILEQAMAALGIDRLVYSDNALREGALLDAWQRRHGSTLHHLHDLRRRSVLHLAELMDDDPEHSERAARLALDLFDATRTLHGMGDESRELLEAGALLANVGLFVSHSGHHKHSYYVIRNSDHLSGFTDHEVELIALVARYHRKSAPKASHPEFDRLGADDQHLVCVLAGLLRIAIGLDRTHAGLAGAVDVTIDDDHDLVEVAVEVDPDTDLSLELYTANDRSGLLADVLGKRVRVTERTTEPLASTR